MIYVLDSIVHTNLKMIPLEAVSNIKKAKILVTRPKILDMLEEVDMLQCQKELKTVIKAKHIR